jgi:hypothetical protein
VRKVTPVEAAGAVAAGTMCVQCVANRGPRPTVGTIGKRAGRTRSPKTTGRISVTTSTKDRLKITGGQAMKRWTVILSGVLILISSASYAARRPKQRNYEATSAWNTKRPGQYDPTPPNNRPTGPIAGVTGAPGRSIAPQGAGNSLKSRVPYDTQRGTNGIYPDAIAGSAGPGSRIGSFGSGQSAPGFPGSEDINKNSQFNKQSPDDSEVAADLPDGLQEALDDISNSWKKRDARPIRLRFPSQKSVAVYQGGSFSYEASGAELAKQVAAGVEQLQTQKFELNAPTKQSPTRYFVSGKHAFLDSTGQKQQFYVSYVLEKTDQRWQIAEYGVSDKPVTRHSAPPAREESFGPGASTPQ